MSVSIVIPTCKRIEEVSGQLRDIQHTSLLDGDTFASCTPGSASHNRNICLNDAKGEIVVMLDDDITGFFPGWDAVLIRPLLTNDSVGIVSARLLTPKNTFAYMMGDPHIYEGVVPSIGHGVPTACIAFRKNDIRFDENFQGSGFEDSDYIKQWRLKFPNDKIVINNDCQLIHINNMTNQKGSYWDHNKSYFLSKWQDEKDVWK